MYKVSSLIWKSSNYVGWSWFRFTISEFFIILRMLLLTNILLLLLLPAYTFADCNDYDLTVTLRNPPDSRIKGECKYSNQGRTYYSFKNIPYAMPPIGKRRLQKPEPVQPWNTIFDATGNDMEKVCLQDPIFMGDDIFGTEDCLVLNIYTPKISKNSSKLLPVMFWIHGGGYQFGSGTQILGFGSLDRYNPAYFMDEEIVVVTINYRLGALGFLTTQDDVIPANLGLRDQNLALRWVEANIDLFGGDPKDIVLSGESVGATSTCHHLLSNGPELQAITGAMMISGTCIAPFGFGLNFTARANAFAVGQKLGLDDSSNANSARLLQVLQNVPAKTLLRTAGIRTRPHKSDDGEVDKWLPVYAKDFYPTGPMTDAIDQGRFYKVPLLFGVNSEECLSPVFLEFLPQIERKARLWDQDPSKMIDVTLNVPDRLQAGREIKAIYTNSFSGDVAALVKFCTDYEFTLPVGRHAESASKYGVPVYIYQLDYEYILHLIPGVEGVAHAEDLFIYWKTAVTKIGGPLLFNFDLIRQRMVRLLTNFVKYKKPVVGRDALFQNLEFPKFNSENLQYMKIDTELEVRSNMRNYSAKRKVYDRQLQRPISVY